jgi:hypothetical protein
MSRWILDMECYQMDSEIFPVEIALLNADVNQCFVYYISYPKNNYSHAARKYQFSRHGFYWHNGDQTLDNAVKDICQKVTVNEATYNKVYVKGHEKHKLVSTWFLSSNGIRQCDVIDIGNDAPNFLVMKNLCMEKTCDKHGNKLHLFCARRKCYQLLPYIPIAAQINTEEGDPNTAEYTATDSSKPNTVSICLIL